MSSGFILVLRGLRRAWFPAAIVFLYLYSFPYFEHIRSANELPRIYLTQAMVERHAFDIGPELAAYQPTPDTSQYKGKLYSNKAPGSSIVAIPGYAILSAIEGSRPKLSHLFFASRLAGSTVPSLIFLLFVWRMLREVIPHRPSVQRLVFAAYALGSMAFIYGTLLFSHQLAAAFIGGSFFGIFLYARTRAGPWAPLWAGLAAGAAVLVDYQAAFVGPPLFVYLLVRAKPRIRSAALFSAGAALPLAFLLYYHWACFGSPFSTGYEHLTNPVFAQWTSRGFLGLDTFELGRWVKRHFSPDEGLFYYSPFLLMAFPGLVLMLRRRGFRAEAAFTGFVMVFFFYFIGALVLVSGWDVGPRYIIVALPFYLMPVAVLFRGASRRWALMAFPAALAVLSIGIYLAVGSIFPHFPGNFSDPLFDVTWRFGAAGYVSYNAGWLVGLKGLWSLIPYAVVALAVVFGALCGVARGWRRVAIMGASLALVALILFGYRGALRWRQEPVPVKFLPWMDRIWEPRHPQMDKRALFRQIGSKVRR
ncbi:MAG: hypothetical protein KAI47_06575 [Deltaproteobacteria bacterium]|nr:hypothetical protein [Deltaproteobacteria bacterium]